MALPRSRVTAQGQISIPAEVRRKLGVGPGSILEWHEEDHQIIVRRSGTYSSEDIHRALFGKQAPQSRTLDKLKEGIRQSVRQRHAIR
jgi:AbrB family looped-hinge helix DNA binding protein